MCSSNRCRRSRHGSARSSEGCSNTSLNESINQVGGGHLVSVMACSASQSVQNSRLDSASFGGRTSSSCSNSSLVMGSCSNGNTALYSLFQFCCIPFLSRTQNDNSYGAFRGSLYGAIPQFSSRRPHRPPVPERRGKPSFRHRGSRDTDVCFRPDRRSSQTETILLDSQESMAQ